MCLLPTPANIGAADFSSVPNEAHALQPVSSVGGGCKAQWNAWRSYLKSPKVAVVGRLGMKCRVQRNTEPVGSSPPFIFLCLTAWMQGSSTHRGSSKEAMWLWLQEQDRGLPKLSASEEILYFEKYLYSLSSSA